MSVGEVRRLAVGLSAEAVAGAWARREHALHGSVAVLDVEIAGRLRNGVPTSGSSAVAVIVRPALAIADEDRLWVAALVAACGTGTTVWGSRPLAVWPDRIEIDGSPAAFVNVTSEFESGRIGVAIVTLRVLDASITAPFELFRDLVVHSVGLVSAAFSELTHTFIDHSALHGRRVRAVLLPRGETRGTVTGLGSDGCLRLETATGMVELLSVSSVRRIDLVPPSPAASRHQAEPR